MPFYASIWKELLKHTCHQSVNEIAVLGQTFICQPCKLLLTSIND